MTLDRRLVALDLNADIDTVWAHLRQPELVRRWYGWGSAEHDLPYLIDSEVEERKEGRRRMLAWADGTHLHLAPTADPYRTSLVINRPSPAGVSPFDGLRDGADEFWLASVSQLKFALAVHPGEDRRMWSVFGMDAGTLDDLVLDRVGLRQVYNLPIGGRLEAVRQDGTRLGGTVAYRKQHQFGLQLHGVTESLMVVLEHPASVRPPNGQFDAILSTYGLNDDDFGAVGLRWMAWWQVANVAVAL